MAHSYSFVIVSSRFNITLLSIVQAASSVVLKPGFGPPLTMWPAETKLESPCRMAREVGIPACSAFLAFAEERYTDAVELLLSIRTIAHRFGGSHAQRDILTQTLIESAICADNTGLASNLISERSVHKPFSPLTRRFNAKIKTD